ncbi:MAG: AAA family ATPase [Ginsengibacter sp.]
MSKYKEFEEKVFNWLMDKHKNDSAFTFSLRKVGKTGAETDYFTGTEKSNYFGTTFWHIIVAYPGNANELIGLIFKLNEQGYSYIFRFQQTKTPHNDQNKNGLDFIRLLKPIIKSNFQKYSEVDTEKNKIEYFSIESPKSNYESIDSLLADADIDLKKLIPIVDQELLNFKKIYPEFSAQKFSEAEFKTMLDKFKTRRANFSKPDIMTPPLKPVLVNQAKINRPLNTILYGPPGTGKTYNSIVKAAEIITGEQYETKERYEIAKQFFRNESGKQVEFVTFHQNYSYEDFVAGLRPDVEAASIGLRFVEHKGIFYKICQRAKENYQQYSSGQTFIEPTFEEVLEVFLQPLVEDEEIEVATIARNVTFHITANNNGKNLSFRKQSGGTQHTLSISTLKDLYYEKREYNLQGLGIYFRPVVDKLKQIAKGMRKETGKIALKNYVLIIDEINRANISRVFGELITLLEPDKRLGAANELRLRLPGLPEEELFSVPPNLYIVGTMNTADKSIALIDIALRRRFVFEDIYPRPDLIDALVNSPYNEFLKALNEQILAKKGPDFLIGHSYLMPDEGEELDFLIAMNQKIIPLLNEYFYNQRNISVLSLLQSSIAKVPGFVVEKDDYVGVVCKQAL